MILVDHLELRSWLERGEFSFEWDDGNISKNSLKHGFSIDEIESIFAGTYIFIGVVVREGLTELRGVVLGQTFTEKFATLVFCRRGESLRPISCRPMRENERSIYFSEVML